MRNLLTRFPGVIVVLLLTFGVIANAQDVKVATVLQPPSSIPDFAGWAADAIVVKFDRATVDRMDPAAKLLGKVGIDAIDAVNRRFNVFTLVQSFPDVKPVAYQGRIVDLYGWHRVSFPEGVNVEEVVAAYKSLPGVLEAQPIGIHRLDKLPNDGSFPGQWHLNRANDKDMDAPEAWDVQTGNTSILVTILDTGVRYYHKDLGGSNASSSNPIPANIDGNIWKNANEIPGDGLDNDGNGYIDDWTGWDFVSSGSNCYPGEDCSTPDNDPRDFNGHGTHCAGIVAAINNNAYAVSSVAGGWMAGSQAPGGNGVKVLPMRIGWSAGRGFYEVGYVDMGFAASAFRYAADRGAKIASCSWGNSNSGGIAEAVDYFLGKGGLIFNSAGNSNNESASYLCSRSDVIAVASTDSNDLKSDFSSFGTWVDISAPGSVIWSTYHSHADAANDYIAALSGTSMACPNAAAVAALIWSQNPTWSATQVRDKLFSSADPIDALNPGYTGKLGAGRVNAFAGVSGGGTTPPNAPTNLTASAVSSSQINLAWTDNATNETGFRIFRGSTQGGAKTELTTVGANVTTYNNTGLSPNTPYYYEVEAYNSAGPSARSNEAGTTTLPGPQPPLAPTNLTASAVSSSQINLSWTDNANDEDGFKIFRCTGSGCTNFTQIATVGPNVTTYNNTGLAANTTYNYQVKAYNAGGDSGPSNSAEATTQPSSQPTMHVASVVVVREVFMGRRYRGKATVTIADANGAPVASANGTGQWSGGATNTSTFTTGSDGKGVTYSNWNTKPVTFQYCVTNVTKTGWLYDPAANVGGGCGSVNEVGEAAPLGGNEEIVNATGAPGLKEARNYPNPFNPSTTIAFTLDAPTHLTIDIYDMLGRKVLTLLDDDSPAGVVSATWHGVDSRGNLVGSGQYIYVIRTAEGTTVRRTMLLLK